MDWDYAANDAANAYVKTTGYGGSYDALGQKQVFIAAAGSHPYTSIEDVIKAALAGRAWAQTQTMKEE